MYWTGFFLTKIGAIMKRHLCFGEQRYINAINFPRKGRETLGSHFLLFPTENYFYLCIRSHSSNRNQSENVYLPQCTHYSELISPSLFDYHVEIDMGMPFANLQV